MHRFFLDLPLVSGTIIDAPRDRAHQLIRVLRVSIGESIVVFNGRGGEYQACIRTISGHHCAIEVSEHRDPGTESALRIRLFQGVPKKEKLEFIAQKAVELGVSELTPVISRFCATHVIKRADRIPRIIEEATEQSGRVKLMRFSEAVSFEQALAASQDADLRLIAWEKERSDTLRSIHSTCPDARTIALFVGPEGGWAEEEIDLALGSNVIPFSLGPRIWRTETAGIVAPALVLHEWTRVSG